MSENKSAIILSGLSSRDFCKQNSPELAGYIYIVDKVSLSEFTECEWSAAVNIEFFKMLLAGERHPHQKIFEFFISVINTGFVPLEFPKAENAFVDIDFINRSDNLWYKLTITCVKSQDAGSSTFSQGLTWHISEYFGEQDADPETFFLDSTIDDAVLMGKEVLQWNRAAIHLTEVKHPFAKKMIAVFGQSERIVVCP
ncbi:MAG: hypothetical protein E7054_09660 [Lentisphaerae bacterium]|nr:hypothetical protein [Lentisphaerota bacterium]